MKEKSVAETTDFSLSLIGRERIVWDPLDDT